MIEARGSRAVIVRAYDFFSLLYGSTAARLEREAGLLALRRTPIRAGDRVLEVAVGTGVWHEKLRERLGGTRALAGVDLSTGMLRATRKRVPDARLARADGRALPFAGESFDLLWSSYLLDLIPTPDLGPLLAEFHRVLRPGGRLTLVNLSKNGAAPTRWERVYERTPDWLVPWLFGSCRPVQAEGLVRAAGFTEIQSAFVPGYLESEILWAKKN